MANAKRITNLTDYTSILPYASELFGVYQPLIGWKSKRKFVRANKNEVLVSHYGSISDITFNVDHVAELHTLLPGQPNSARLAPQHNILLKELSLRLKGKPIPTENEWSQLINRETLTEILHDKVFSFYQNEPLRQRNDLAVYLRDMGPEVRDEILRREGRNFEQNTLRAINDESAIAGMLLGLVENNAFNLLRDTFYINTDIDSTTAFRDAVKAMNDFKDPYLTFDPKKDVKDVSLSPLGIVHLYRQYFFELDTFLGTPTGHVWLSPGSTVELIEVSTRKTVTEKTVEATVENIVKSETSTTNQDEISEAVKEDNKSDLKLGVTSTVNQSWGTGNASATASLNMDKTQQVARESTHKRMRQQSEKLAKEIRQNYKSTFKTVTEVTDMSSKRYVLTNNTNELINYELRRKMRQVAVQVHDIGSYLCWETFVDDPGKDVGLANLIHIAQPPDLLPVPDSTDMNYPPDRPIAFQTNVTWNFGDTRQHGEVYVGHTDSPPAPEGYEIVKVPDLIPLHQISSSGEDFTGAWAFGGRLTPEGKLNIFVITGPGGLEWDKRVDFVVGGALLYTPTATKKAEIDAANKKRKQEAADASAANDRKTKETFIKAAKERIEMAASITKRNSEELREEERTIVYRRLISSLMTEFQYKNAEDKTRHILSELINSIFDIDKMLYFVAPEWWKPRERSKQFLSLYDLESKLNDSIVTWSDSRKRPDNYLITDKSAPAAMGSSLGWLLQLDADNLRNAFLNSPWVKAVIPVRPGKEQAAINWLQMAMVEGADGLDAAYAAPADELQKIKTRLEIGENVEVTIKDAINYLCLEVAEKYEESNKVKTFPDTEINDDNKVASTPIEKVYEHGFYPLKGGFRVNPNDPNPDPNNENRYFQVFDQWIEVLPTDQVVPVEVTYDPKTGRQVP